MNLTLRTLLKMEMKSHMYITHTVVTAPLHHHVTVGHMNHTLVMRRFLRTK